MIDGLAVATITALAIIVPAVAFVWGMERLVDRCPKLLEWIERVVDVDLGGEQK